MKNWLIEAKHVAEKLRTNPFVQFCMGDATLAPLDWIFPALLTQSLNGKYFRISLNDSPTLETLRAPRRWSRPDSASDPWSTLGNLAMGANRRPIRSLPPRKNKKTRDPPWGPRDLAKASRLLEKPPMSVSFEDDQEMRRVYSLIYDVFRCE
jgi:hypothetical protein